MPPVISAALIVKNEEDSLPRSLASVRDAVDEIVVVDTGSTDRTIEIAEQFGAKIGDFTWCDDFAAARNAALALTTGEWILSIDADDELVTGGGPNVLREAIDESPEAKSMLFEYRSVLTDDPNAAPSFAIVHRLFRRMPGIHWDRPVHEVIVQPGSEDLPIFLFDGDQAHLRHYGYAGDLGHEKAMRNIVLLERHLEEKPDDLVSHAYMAREWRGLGEIDKAEAEARTYLNLSARVSGHKPFLADMYCVVAESLISQGRKQEALATLLQGDAEVPRHIYLQYLLAGGLANAKRFREALPHIELSCELPLQMNLLPVQEVFDTDRFTLRDKIKALIHKYG